MDSENGFGALVRSYWSCTALLDVDGRVTGVSTSVTEDR